MRRWKGIPLGGGGLKKKPEEFFIPLTPWGSLRSMEFLSKVKHSFLLRTLAPKFTPFLSLPQRRNLWESIMTGKVFILKKGSLLSQNSKG